MKIYSLETSHGTRLAVHFKGQNSTDKLTLLSPDKGWPTCLKKILESEELLSRLASFQLEDEADQIAMDESRLLAPIRQMEKVVCIGKNYANHAKEMGAEAPELPIVFNKFPSTIIAQGEDVVLPDISEQVDYEAELVVVIGKPGKHIDRSNALDHVFGFTCGNDISARDWQRGRPGGQWLLGKTFDTFAPLGPCIVTKDELGNGDDLPISFRLNGEKMQESNTKNFIFPIDFLISHVSKFVTLYPGDLLFTGTPEGVGAGRKPPVFLKSGDKMEVDIPGIGVLSNTVV